MEMMSTVVIAWQWLKLATVAKTALINGNGEFSSDFYTEQVNTMRFYFKYELPKILACKATLMSEDSLTIVKEDEVAFSFS